MSSHLARNWWLVVLRGVIAIIFGILVVLRPGITVLALTIFFGAYALVDGFFAVIAALTHHTGSQRWWVLLLEGVAGIAAGILTFVWPGLTALVLLYFIAAWALVTGVLEIVGAIELRREITNEWLLVLSGIASVLFGLLLAIFPRAGALAIVWLIGAYAIVFGILLLALGLRLRGIHPKAARVEPRTV